MLVDLNVFLIARGDLRGGRRDYLGCLGVHLDVHLGVFGWPLASILGTPGHVRRALGAKTPFDSFSGASF